MSEFVMFPLPEGTIRVNAEDLAIAKALDFAATLSATPGVSLVECLRMTTAGWPFVHQNDEVVIFEVSVEVGQQPANDIRYIERIAVHFDIDDRFTPWVFALRDDFPKVAHLNSMPFEKPRSLCIYEIPYHELKLEWRSSKFLGDICGWLSLTAKNELHQHTQALEPLLVYNSGTIIIPPDVKPGETLIVYAIASRGTYLSLVGSRIDLPDRERYPSHFLAIKGNIQPHGIMGRTPYNLTDLNELLLSADIKLFDTLKTTFQGFIIDKAKLSQRLCLFLELPKTGAKRELAEQDFHVFLSGETIEEIGIALGFFQHTDAGLGNIHFEPTDNNLGQNLSILPLVPQIQLTPELALLLSGNSPYFKSSHYKYFLIGAGALGSQFFLNQARSGFGRWIVTDDDFLLPHNLVRHGLDMNFLGHYKSIGVAFVANQLYGGEDFSFALTDDFLYPADPDKFYAHLKEAEIILDCSTSIAVARSLAGMVDIKGRRISMFLSPNGQDLVILAEDTNRAYPLDVLEFQYYRLLADRPQLADHLNVETGIRLSNSCRDITSRISQENVALLAAIAANQFRKITLDDMPLIGIWRVSPETMVVSVIKAPITDADSWQLGGWAVYIDHQLIETIAQARLAHLPNETGGILIGGYDLERKTLYLMDTILSPGDSKEYPTSYIRGTEGVEKKLADFSHLTAGHLKYVGEWHSHPTGCCLDMSKDDTILFSYLSKEMEAINLPALMLIAGDNKSYQIYLNS